MMLLVTARAACRIAFGKWRLPDIEVHQALEKRKGDVLVVIFSGLGHEEADHRRP
jgi:hypothetical protein